MAQANFVSLVTPHSQFFATGTPTNAQTNLHIVPQANAVLHPDTGAVMEYRALVTHPKAHTTWTTSFASELGRLAQRVGARIKGTDTIFFIPKTAVPPDGTVTYGRIVCDYRPQKSEPECTRLTVGGNLVDYQ